MSDTVFEKNYDGNRLTVGRFWRDGEDWIQFTTNTEYSQIPYKDFKKMVIAVKNNVEETKNAWWHEFSKK